MKNILLLTDLSCDYCRKLLQGIVQFSKENCSWNFYRLPFYFKEVHGDKGIVNWAKKWEADAIIAQFDDIDIDVLKELNIPIIVQNYKERNKQISNITGDYYSAGVLAADFFYKKGYRNFAYYDFKDTVWMRERGEGFISSLKEYDCEVLQYENDKTPMDELALAQDNLKHWLLNLPKPIALFACDDQHALQITEACKIAGIDVPNDIAVLGVDNDELLCNVSDPKLSSIELNVVNGGYLAGELLHLFLEKKAAPPIDVVIKPIMIVSRESTEKVVIANEYIKTVVKYIENEYMEDISVSTILNIVPLSRRVLEKLFKSETGTTIYQYIQSIRIENFAKLILTTNISLIEGARRVGYYDYKNVSRIFRKEKQLTPSQYRKMYATHPENNRLYSE